MIATENGFASVQIITTRGWRDMPCEPVTDSLAIVPAFKTDERDESILTGGFAVTHVPTGRTVTRKHACLRCTRTTAGLLAASGVDWAGLDFSGQNKPEKSSPEWIAVKDAMHLFEGCPHTGGDW